MKCTCIYGNISRNKIETIHRFLTEHSVVAMLIVIDYRAEADLFVKNRIYDINNIYEIFEAWFWYVVIQDYIKRLHHKPDYNDIIK